MHPCKDCDIRQSVKKSGKTIWNISLQLTDDCDPAPFTKRQIRNEVIGTQKDLPSGLKVSKVKIEKVSK